MMEPNLRSSSFRSRMVRRLLPIAGSPSIIRAAGMTSRDGRQKGNLIYFISDRDGYLCLWAQRVASHGKELVGTPFPVYHFHDTRLSMANVDTGILEIGVAEDKIVIGLGELTGNIWSLRRKQRS